VITQKNKDLLRFIKIKINNVIKYKMSFDIVICVGPNDTEVAERNVMYSSKNIIGHRNIYLICSNPNVKINGAVTIDENTFPFNISTVAEIHGKRVRNGWYLQQLLKMYAGKIIPGILENYLIIDCDTVFIKPTKFITEDGKYCMTTGTEYHSPYFEHMNSLHPSLKKIHPLSGISHHTFFNNVIVSEMIEMIENHHNNSEPFWKLYLKKVLPKDYELSGAAENELYFTYAYLYHPEKLCIRQLKWINSGIFMDTIDCDFISVHWYMRK
jgi:hypothetical protein